MCSLGTPLRTQGAYPATLTADACEIIKASYHGPGSPDRPGPRATSSGPLVRADPTALYLLPLETGSIQANFYVCDFMHDAQLYIVSNTSSTITTLRIKNFG